MNLSQPSHQSTDHVSTTPIQQTTHAAHPTVSTGSPPAPLHRPSLTRRKKIALILGLQVLLVVGLISVTLVARNLAQEEQSIQSSASAANALKATVSFNPKEQKPISKYIWGVNHFHFAMDNQEEKDPYLGEKKEDVKSQGIKLLRFPGGCPGDVYNFRTRTLDYTGTLGGDFKNINAKIWSIEDEIKMAKDIDAEILYQVNVETKNLANPCTMVSRFMAEFTDPNNRLSEQKRTPELEQKRKDQLLKDAVHIVKTYGGTIKMYELGNEAWGEWEPKEYGAVALEFARAMKAENRSIKIGLVGHPSTGNNQNVGLDTSAKDAQWTAMVKDMLKEKCGSVDCFDFVSDHPYPTAGYANTPTWKAPENGLLGAKQSATTTNRPFQYRTQSLIAADGKLSFIRTCLYSYDEKGLLLCSDWKQDTSLALAGEPASAKIGGYSGYVFVDASGKQKLRQTLLNEEGTKMWTHVCEINDDKGLDFTKCRNSKNKPEWDVYPITDLRGAGDEAYASLAEVVLALEDTVNGKKERIQVVRQSIVNSEGTDAWVRLCPLDADGNPKTCGGWTSLKQSFPAKVAYSSYDEYINYQYGPNDTLVQNLTQTFTSKDGKVQWYRQCTYRIGQWNNMALPQCPTGWRSFDLGNLVPSNPNSAYIATANFTYFTNSDRTDQDIARHNTPGEMTFYAKGEFVTPQQASKDHQGILDKRLADYSPKGLGLTEWNTITWTGEMFGIKTAEHGMFIFESLLSMAEKGVHNAAFHSYPARGSQMQAFKLSSPLAGGTLVPTTVTGSPPDSLLFEVPRDSSCLTRSCLKGGYTLSYVNATSGYSADKKDFYVMISNKHATKPAELTFNSGTLPDLTNRRDIKLLLLSAKSFTDPAFKTHPESALAYPRTGQLKVTIPPASIARITFSVKADPPSKAPPKNQGVGRPVPVPSVRVEPVKPAVRPGQPVARPTPTTIPLKSIEIRRNN